MKYICLGYIDETKWDAVPESEQNALMDECFAYDDELRANGHFVGAKRSRAPGTPPHCDGRTER
jgi:hypothetical protein